VKRSEVAEKLAELLEFQRQDLNNGSDFQDAEAVLDFLEEIGGMKPPIRKVCPVLFTEEFVWEKEDKNES